MRGFFMKEKVLVCVCFTLAALLLVSGAYDFLIVEFVPAELVMSIGATLILIGMGFAPNMFFTPLNKDYLTKEAPSIVHPRVQQWFFFTGLSLSGLGMILRLLL